MLAVYFSKLPSQQEITLVLAVANSSYGQNEKYRAKLDGNNEVRPVNIIAECVINFKFIGKKVLIRELEKTLWLNLLHLLITASIVIWFQIPSWLDYIRY